MTYPRAVFDRESRVAEKGRHCNTGQLSADIYQKLGNFLDEKNNLPRNNQLSIGSVNTDAYWNGIIYIKQ